MRDIGETREYFTAIKQPRATFILIGAFWEKSNQQRVHFYDFFSEKRRF
jgi:hypothetical protein